MVVALSARTMVALPTQPGFCLGVGAGPDGCTRDASIETAEGWVASVATLPLRVHAFLAGELEVGLATLRVVIVPVAATAAPQLTLPSSFTSTVGLCWVDPACASHPLVALLACAASQRAESFVRVCAPLTLPLRVWGGAPRMLWPAEASPSPLPPSRPALSRARRQRPRSWARFAVTL